MTDRPQPRPYLGCQVPPPCFPPLPEPPAPTVAPTPVPQPRRRLRRLRRLRADDAFWTGVLTALSVAGLLMVIFATA
ncbi:hypothetical protein [Streptomyces sp. SID13726]|uniref:hypothetical protein n=1 Tax=Streptomyces sp. SID13726 TaxID=2706058 RepID=UPI0013BCBB10|nr:hypothetical protein [Streptomyces sp. SID13726]NEB03910.1 hypothetical protein [Streptomyces sp. SID13726]